MKNLKLEHLLILLVIVYLFYHYYTKENFSDGLYVLCVKYGNNKVEQMSPPITFAKVKDNVYRGFEGELHYILDLDKKIIITNGKDVQRVNEVGNKLYITFGDSSDRYFLMKYRDFKKEFSS